MTRRQAVPAERATLPRVLCVDDELHVLAALADTLRRKFDVVTAASAAEGLRVLADQQPFAVVMSDFKMPAMDGAEFLAQVRLAAPDATRVLLTGQATLENAITVVNDGRVFRFLTKPCSPPDLVRALEAAVEQYRIVTEDRVLVQRKIEQMSAHLLRAERLATLGTMASAVGHEISNILMVVDGATALIEEDVAAGRPPSERDLKSLRQAQAHLAVHGRNLLHLGRPAHGEASTTNLADAVSDVVEMLRSAGVLARPRLRLALSESMPARARKSQIEQVFLNLIKNAVEALEESSQPDPEIAIRIGAGTVPGTVVGVVADNANGIPAAKLPLLFEPYYTSKSPDRGTGLGLFVVRQIARSAGGDVTVESKEGTGTAFTVTLPAAAADESVGSGAASSSSFTD